MVLCLLILSGCLAVPRPTPEAVTPPATPAPADPVLAGQVRDAADGHALPSAQVIIGSRSFGADAEGRFEVTLDPGAYEVQAVVGGYVTARFRITLSESGGRSEYYVDLIRRRLRGVVREDGTQKPIAEASLVYGPASARSGPEGSFELDAPEPQALAVSRPGYLPAEMSLAEVQAQYESFGAQRTPLEVSLVPRVLTGRVSEAGTARPISGALVSTGAVSAYSDADGRYELRYVEPGTALTASSPAHRRAQGIAYAGQVSQDVALDPWQVTLTVKDRVTGQALPQARITTTVASRSTDSRGQATLRVLPRTSLTVTLGGYRPASLPYEEQEALDVSLQPQGLVGELRDRSTGQPIPKALVQVYTVTAPLTQAVPALLRSDAEGRFALQDASAVTALAIKAPGYRRVTVPVTETGRLRIEMQPFEARAIYVPFGLLTLPKVIDDLLKLVEESELNTVVVDVKSDRARLAWRSAQPLAQETGAYLKGVMDLQEFLRKCHERDIYTIARMVVFKDNLVAQKHPEWAVARAGGGVYRDLEGLSWVDPFRQEVRDYMIALAQEVAVMGFDEVQFDYLRFPSDGQTKGLAYSQENTPEKRTAMMAEFCAQTYAALNLTPAFFSADVFGLTVWVAPSNDMGIGQRLDDIVPSVDYVSPMLYPSTFIPGNLGLDNPARYPYEVINRSVQKTQERIQQIAGPVATRVRPWLQHYALRNTPYGLAEYLKQKKGAEEARSCGWIFWNAGGKYDPKLFMPAQ